MKQEKSTFQQTFIYLYYLMLSADRVADIKELKLGNKIIKLENLDKSGVMKEIDVLSSTSRKDVFDKGLALLKSLNRKEQLKCLGYIKLIAKIDGSVDSKESELLNSLRIKELNISLEEVAEMEEELGKSISEISD